MTTVASGSHSSNLAWKYRLGLLLILAVVLIWVGSAEVTQLIFEKYRHPFLLTWLGASLLAIYLPLAYLKDYLSPYFSKCTAHQQPTTLSRSKERAKAQENDAIVVSTTDSLGVSQSTGPVPRAKSPREVELANIVATPISSPTLGNPKAKGHQQLSPRFHPIEEEESAPLLSSNGDVDHDVAKQGGTEYQLSLKEVVYVSMLLAPLWLLTEYLSNAALSMTSVSSTTILSSTSGLFTLLFGVTVGGDKLTTGKVLAALVSIAGVMMTELGKSSAVDDQQVFGDADRNPGEATGQYALPGHNLAGDICGLLSAVSYGFYTTLLRKYIGGEGDGEEKADLQKVFGFIGLFTLLGLWWLVVPLYFIGWEPVPVLPSNYGLDEDILANGLVGSVISDYFWAVSVVWTTPLVATLGLSLTIPLAMVADMVMHGRDYSLVYILGACGVFAGFLVANLGDNFSIRESSWWQWLTGCFSCCCPARTRRTTVFYDADI